MKKISSALLFFLGLGVFLPAQNLIGYTKAEILRIMKEEHRDYVLNTSTKNPVYRYLKYEDRTRTRTILFFLSEDDKCTYFKFLGDYSYLKTKTAELNEKYRKINESTWMETRGDEKFRIELEKGEWFFTVTTRKADG